jgi:hypothetical protein
MVEQQDEELLTRAKEFLIDYVFDNDTERINKMLTTGFNVNIALNASGQTILHLAAQLERPAVF